MYWLQYRRQAAKLECRAVAVAPLLRYGQSRSAPAALLRGCARGPHCGVYCAGLSSAPSPTGLGLPPSPAGFTCQGTLSLEPCSRRGAGATTRAAPPDKSKLDKNRGSLPSRVKRSAPPRAPLTAVTSTKAGHHIFLALYQLRVLTQLHTAA